MKKSLIIMFLFICVPAFIHGQSEETCSGKSLIILWQRATCKCENPCERCHMAPKEVKIAHEKLRAALAELDIEVILDEKTEEQEGEYILINNKALEDWLAGKLVKRQCASCAHADGKAKEYNALELHGIIYDIIPHTVIIKAGLLAASDMCAANPFPPCKDKSKCQEECQDKD